MDFFGIGAAVKGAVEIYFRSARASGRTTSLLESIRDGDRVVCATSEDMHRMWKLCQERNLDVQCICISPDHPDAIFQYSTSHGRTIFDHRWLEQYYIRHIESAMRSIDYLQRQSSGWSEAHEETRLAYQERAKWQY